MPIVTVVLREPVESDLPALYAYQRDPAAIEMAAFRGREDWDTFLAHWQTTLRDETLVRRVIVTSEDQVAGSIASWQKDDLRLLGYILGRDHWGKGIATEALRQFLELMTVRPVHAFVIARNIGSRRVLEKNGFAVIRERRCPPDERWKDWVDELLMRLV